MRDIRHYEHIGGTPIVGMAMEAMTYLLQNGAFPNVGLKDSYKGIGCFEHDTLVGCLVWGDVPEVGYTYIVMGYVVPGERGRGIYDDMWEALKLKTKELGRTRIMSETRLTNTAMRKVAKRQGRKETVVTLEYLLDQQG